MKNYLDALLDGPIPRELSFSSDEYSQRLIRVREEMAAREIDVLLVHSAVDLCYLTGYQTLWPDAYACLILPLSDAPFMQVGEIEASCAVLHGEIEDFELFDWVGADAVPTQLASVLTDRGYGRCSIGVQAGRIDGSARHYEIGQLFQIPQMCNALVRCLCMTEMQIPQTRHVTQILHAFVSHWCGRQAEVSNLFQTR